jgi:hypothetical protein
VNSYCTVIGIKTLENLNTYPKIYDAKQITYKYI